MITAPSLTEAYYGTLMGSLEDRKSKIDSALQDWHRDRKTEKQSAYIRVVATFSDYVIAEIEDYSTPGRKDECVRIAYSILDGEIQFGEPTKVEIMSVIVKKQEEQREAIQSGELSKAVAVAMDIDRLEQFTDPDVSQTVKDATTGSTRKQLKKKLNRKIEPQIVTNVPDRHREMKQAEAVEESMGSFIPVKGFARQDPASSTERSSAPPSSSFSGSPKPFPQSGDGRAQRQNASDSRRSPGQTSPNFPTGLGVGPHPDARDPGRAAEYSTSRGGSTPAGHSGQTSAIKVGADNQGVSKPGLRLENVEVMKTADDVFNVVGRILAGEPVDGILVVEDHRSPQDQPTGVPSGNVGYARMAATADRDKAVRFQQLNRSIQSNMNLVKDYRMALESLGDRAFDEDVRRNLIDGNVPVGK